ncbi:hypothetical protein [Rhizobium leguminosarum]|uniref:hypothetical protein n=1 Tax=Rhizobium leguminosarum TaxID=384 RepID=UPI0010326594|nr:hypothetical protein [Rhizobium leguminosarum]TBG15987.1 hypothetical protein ELG80_08980 [Rhizobium leguminosarum]
MYSALKVALIAAIFCATAASAAEIDTSDMVIPKSVGFPSSPVGSNVVYGRIEYEIFMSQNQKDAKTSWENFLRLAVTNAFGGEDGSYVVTLVVKSGGQEVAKKAISSFTWKNKNFFFVTRESSISSEMSWKGRLLDHFPVTNSNNVLSVAIQIQDANTISLDTATFNKFSDDVSLLKFSLIQPALEIAPAMKKPLATMEALIYTKTNNKLSSDTSMSFIASGSSYPNVVDFPVNGPKYADRRLTTSPKMGNGMVVRVWLNTDPSIYESAFKNGKFQNLDLNNVLSEAKVGTLNTGVPFESVLNTDANKQVLSDLMSLDQEKIPTGRSVSGVCRKLWDTLQKYFSFRDAPAIYTAYLDKYETVLNVQGAKAGCVDQFQDTIGNLGISLANVRIAN